MSAYLVERVLLTNDDGFEAEGLKALARAAREIAKEVWIVAPARDSSGSAAGINLHDPLRVAQTSEREFSITGTPADCIIMACGHFMEKTPPDLILSGINRGANLADDVLFSGTTSAALVGAFLGFRAIAFSQALHDINEVRWDHAETLVAPIVSSLLSTEWPKGISYNVNFPDVPIEQITGVTAARQGKGSVLAVEVETRIDKRSKPYYWFGLTRGTRDQTEETDIAAVRKRSISISPLRLDRTDYEVLKKLSQHLASGVRLPKTVSTS
jgi:5'-nucleotidase